ncbi:MAG: hypothetical protein IH863_01600, partial [Chloroflexi bacterium]|nr:hypothetical protein [Chloroflexota bacterium]
LASQRRDVAIAAWDAIAVAFGGALAAKAYHDRCVASWDAVAVAIAAAVPIRRRQIVAIHAWSNATLALNEATVAEAQLRIAQAGLDNKTMKGVTAAIRKAKGGKVASVARKAAEQAVRVATSATVSVKATKPAKVTSGRGKSKTAPEAAAKKTVADRATAATPAAVHDGLTADETAAAIESWRFRESGRFTDKKDPFESFDSPPGRF